MKFKQIIHQFVCIFRNEFCIFTLDKKTQFLTQAQRSAWFGTDYFAALADSFGKSLDIIFQISSCFFSIAVDHRRKRCRPLVRQDNFDIIVPQNFEHIKA